MSAKNAIKKKGEKNECTMIREEYKPAQGLEETNLSKAGSHVEQVEWSMYAGANAEAQIWQFHLADGESYQSTTLVIGLTDTCRNSNIPHMSTLDPSQQHQ